MSERHLVCRLEELRPGDFRVVSTGSRDVLVVRTGEESFAAVTDACPHQGARLSQGRIERIWRAGHGRAYESDERFAVVCPWHNFEFDLSTGCPPFAAEGDCRPRVRRHEVVVEGDDVVVYG
jgi:nitrite reductase/ring-hydroxylating ferredoxin subunit